MTKRSLQRVFWLVAIVALVYAFVTTFIVQVRYVDSNSMEPTIFGSELNGESILVRLDESLPERFDIVVLSTRDNGLLVKRAWGVSGETVAIRNGDVYIDGKLLVPHANRPRPIPVFDDRWHEVENYFVNESTAWSQDTESWLVEAQDVELGNAAGMINLHKFVHDSYLDRDHRVIEGTQVVNDLSARVELRFDESPEGAGFQINLSEWGDRFQALVEPIDASTARITIRRTNSEIESAILEQQEIALTAGAWNVVEFSNIDNTLELRIGERGDESVTVQCSYEANVFDPRDHLRLGRTLDHHVAFAAGRAKLRVRGLRIGRDFFFNSRGDYATNSPMHLSPGQTFVLGDNSARSRDSREFGPVEADQIYGRATRVVWPRHSWRTLGH